MDEALPFPIGAVLDGRYRLTALLGHGGMGAVYRAEQLSLQREVALKVLRADLAGPEAAARFSREALALSRLDHPNIVRVIDSGQAEGRPYLVMELVTGRDLLQELFRGPLPPERAVPILAALCDALAAAHAQGIIHRDLKPENVILTEQGAPKILDFGIAVAGESSRVTAAGFVLGTPEYLAPEQAMGQPLTPRSDLYTLGVVAYRMLSGVLPFTAAEPRDYLLLHAGTPCPDLREKWPAGKEWPELCDAVMKVLSKDPSQRFATAPELKAALEAALAHRLAIARPVSSSSPSLRTAAHALGVKAQNVCIVFAALSDWDQRNAALPPHVTGALQARFEALLGPPVRRAGGRKVKTTGGTLIFSIPAPTAAVHAAMAMQDALWRADRKAWERDQSGPTDKLSARIALSMGEVTVQEGDVFGEPVNIAARVLEKVGDGEVVFTDAVYLSMNRTDLLADELGPQQLKGIPYPVRTFKVRRAAVAELPPFGTRPPRATELLAGAAAAVHKRVGSRARLAALAAGGVALLALGAWVALAHHKPGPSTADSPELQHAATALAQGHPKDARAILGPLLKSADAPPRALALDGRACIASGEWKQGLERLRDAAKSDDGLRDDLVTACIQALGQSGRRRCPVRMQAITLLTAFDANEARDALERIAKTNECGRDAARAALGAISPK